MTFEKLIRIVAMLNGLALSAMATGQVVQCDPAKVVGADSCARCHLNEVSRWNQTPHAQTFELLVRDPRAKEITARLGLQSIKRNDLCIQCHFTMQNDEMGKAKPIAGISCESCHGAARDWVTVHNDYGSPTATKEMESPQHRKDRLIRSMELGMRNTQNVYLIARSCFQCHTIPHERLVDQGGHPVTSEEFELVAWSQGKVRHNFLRTGNATNGASSTERLRVLFVVGALADLEFSTRATATATEKSTYGLAVANRAARAAIRLQAIQKRLNDPILQSALNSFAAAELKTNNPTQLESIADAISAIGIAFASQRDGSTLAAIDSMLPPASSYK